MGYSAGCVNPSVTGNYIATTTLSVNCTSGLTITGNTFYGNITGFSPSAFPANTYFSVRPTGIQVFVRPNLYEPGRGNITVYNWDLNPTVNVDLSTVLPVGSRYEIRDAQNFFAALRAFRNLLRWHRLAAHDWPDGGLTDRLAPPTTHRRGIQHVHRH